MFPLLLLVGLFSINIYAVSAAAPRKRGQNSSIDDGRTVQMVSDIDFLESICERMQQVGLVESKTAFSTRMLGKGPSYLTSMKARDRHVPDEVMELFRQRLEGDIEDAEAMIAALHERLAQLERQQKHRADLLHQVEVRRTGHVPARQDQPPCRSSVPEWVMRWLVGAGQRVGSAMQR